MNTKSSIILLVLFFFSLPVSASFSEAAADEREPIKFTKHFRQTLFAITEKEEFSIEILPDEKEYKIGSNVVGIVIHNRKDQDVDGADLTVTTGDGNEPLKVREKGDGLYTVSDLDLKRPGEWKLLITVRKKAITDQAAFVFPAAAGKYLTPGKYDALSTR